MSKNKQVYFFGNKTADGNGSMRELLGGKGANLADMNLIGIPVPPGFTITTEVCADYYKLGQEAVIEMIRPEVEAAMKQVEEATGDGRKFNCKDNPLLFSVRSGARASMPGMMDTILNLGMNDEVVEVVAAKSGNPRFAWDSYRRFVQMFGDVVLDMKPQSKEEHDPFEEIIDEMKEKRGVKNDTDLTADDLKELVGLFKKAVKEKTGKDFPSCPWEQLWGSVMAVFRSWGNPRATYYRKLNNIPAEWGTAVNVQAMVFGNMGDTSATGVAFTRDAATGENLFNGEFLFNAQGEDVVSGIRTPLQLTKIHSQRMAEFAGITCEKERLEKYPSLEEAMPEQYQELNAIQNKLETTYKDMQDIEFTIQEKKLWMLQTRNGKRTGAAMVKIAIDMLKEGLIDEQTAILRCEPIKLDELLHPVFDPAALKKAPFICQGLPASPGASTGQIVFFADDAVEWAEAGKKNILVRVETSPEDLHGMNAAEAILTSRGGMTSHAAVVARGMGKCCVAGAGSLVVNYKDRTMRVGDKVYKEGDWISLNGSTGNVYEGQVATKEAELTGDFGELMEMTNKYARLKVRTNAETQNECKVALDFGAVGIGLCRTEHMFFEPDKLPAMREMILAETEEDRRNALAKLLPLQRKDFENVFGAMQGKPVTVRLLDPPLHEFVPHDEKGQEEMAKVMGVTAQKVKEKVESLHELNPMLGHRGCRLGNTYPEITEMQTRAILEACLNLKKRGVTAIPEIMIPLPGESLEYKMQEEIVRNTAKQIFAEQNDSIEFLVGTMIEIPRACLTADLIAKDAEFFSFGTNDLTQMTWGYSRDDVAKFLPIYIEKGILKHDPFQVLDQVGVGPLVKMAVEKGRAARPGLKVGICGEHGGEPSSVEFCHTVGLDYVSCSPYRVPIARLAAAHAAIKESSNACMLKIGTM